MKITALMAALVVALFSVNVAQACDSGKQTTTEYSAS